jgi:signal transduction histidine kinase
MAWVWRPTPYQLLRFGGKRVSTSGTTGERGIGLGLLLVKDFVEQNGAKIQVQSVQGEGTTFFVAFAKVKS